VISRPRVREFLQAALRAIDELLSERAEGETPTPDPNRTGGDHILAGAAQHQPVPVAATGGPTFVIENVTVNVPSVSSRPTVPATQHALAGTIAARRAARAK